MCGLSLKYPCGSRSAATATAAAREVGDLSNAKPFSEVPSPFRYNIILSLEPTELCCRNGDLEWFNPDPWPTFRTVPDLDLSLGNDKEMGK